MKNTAIIKTRVQAKTESTSGIDTLSKTSIALMASVSASIGIWSVVCFSAALFTNGPVGMVKGALTAVTGI